MRFEISLLKKREQEDALRYNSWQKEILASFLEIFLEKKGLRSCITRRVSSLEMFVEMYLDARRELKNAS